MSLLQPLALILASLALVVLAFHIRRRRTVTVPSLRIWRQIGMGQAKRNRVLQWPQPSWPLFLQLLAVLGLAAALAQPLWNRGEAVDHWIFVVDRSGSMQTVSGGADRLAVAKGQLQERMASVAGGGMVSLVALGDNALPLVARQPLAKGTMTGAVASLVAEDGPANWPLLGATVQSLLAPGERSHLVVYSDRDAELGLTAPDLVQETIIVGSPAANASLRATLAPQDDEPGRWTLSGSVLLDGLAGTELVVSYAADGTDTPLEWTRRTIGSLDAAAAVAPEAVSKNFTVNLDLPGAGIVSVALGDDAAAFDNHAWFVTRAEARPLDILYIGAGEQPLLSALRAIDGAAIYQSEGLPDDLSQFGLVVVDSRQVTRQPETNVLWIGDAGVTGAALSALGPQSPTAIALDHPLMRDVAWSTLSIEQAFAIEAAPEADVLLRAGAVPLLSAGTTPAGMDVRLGFDPRDSNWPQQSGLPVFVANLVQWIAVAPQGQLQPSCVVGQRCTLDARLVGGRLRDLTADADTTLQATNFVPVQAGLYQVEHGTRSELLAINPAPVSPIPRRDTQSQEPTPFPIQLWPTLVGVVVLALLAEAIIAGRGTERFLLKDGLRASNQLSTRRRIGLALRVLTLVAAVLAVIDVGFPWRQSGENVAAVVAPGGTAIAEAGSVVIDAPQPGLLSTEAPARAGATPAAITLAAATLPWGQPGRVVVSGDTWSDPDAVVALANPLASRGIVVSAQPAAPLDNTLYVAALQAPEPVYSGDTFVLAGIVHAEADMRATLRFSRDDAVLVEQQVALVAGDNRVETIIADVEQGDAAYSLSVESDADVEPANNTLSRVIEALPAGKVAVIANDPARGQAFLDWLVGQGVTGELVEPGLVPYTSEDWKGFDGAALLDLPAIALTTRQQELLEGAVAEQGLGLLILGGPNSFGPGGYLETPLDRASPLSSRVPRDAPEATLVFVLDRSGSMQQAVGDATRLDVAKQATLAAARLLNRDSQVGVIVFDSEPNIVLPLQRLADPAAVSEALSNVDPGGGTSIYPGLEAAFNMLRDVDTPARHIIVMTDGLSQPADFPGLLSQINSEGITVSSVSIGKGAERTLIEQIARLGGGTFHATDDFAALPSILSQEAMLLSGSPIEEGATQPLWAARDEPFLRGLPAQMPPINGFVLTTPKPEANLSMVVADSRGEPMPLLASWRYGAGQVLALTTEAVGPWSSQWQDLPVYPALWSQAVRQFLPTVERGDITLDVVRRGDGLVAELTLAGDAAGTVPSLGVWSADTETPLPLEQSGPGQFTASYYPTDAGSFRFAATAGDVAAERMVAMGYPAHLGAPSTDNALRRLTAATGGDFGGAGEPAAIPDRWVMQTFWPAWAALALVLLMVELAVRYTGLVRPRSPSPTRPAPGSAARSTPSRREPAPAA